MNCYGVAATPRVNALSNKVLANQVYVQSLTYIQSWQSFKIKCMCVVQPTLLLRSNSNLGCISAPEGCLYPLARVHHSTSRRSHSSITVNKMLWVLALVVLWFVLTPTGCMAQTQTCVTWHKVKGGETCNFISNAAGIDLATFLALNPSIGQDCSNLQLDQYVCVAGATSVQCASTHTVASGETCLSIANSNNIPLKAFFSMNPTVNNPNCDNLIAGTTVVCTRLQNAAKCITWHKVLQGETCNSIAGSASLSLSNFYALNPTINQNCSNLQLGDYVCLINATTTACARYHQAGQGETCSTIAAANNIPLSAFFDMNPQVNNPNCTNLQAGLQYCVSLSPSTTPSPPPSPQGVCTSTYTVVQDDTCSSIATKTGTKLTQILNLNPDVNADCKNLIPGQQLCLARSSAESSSAKKSHAGAIAGGVVGGIVGLGLLAALLVWGYRRHGEGSNADVTARTTSQNMLVSTDGTARMTIDNDLEFGNVHEMVNIAKEHGYVTAGQTSTPNTNASSRIAVTAGSSYITGNTSAAQSNSTALTIPATPSTFASTPMTGDFTAIQMHLKEVLLINWSDIRIGETLGQGGFGMVYKGMWRTHRVAVKTVNLDAGDRRAKEVLHEEALIMSTLHHPNIARVYGLVDEGDNQALVMQYYKRGTLAKAMTSIWFRTMDEAGRLKLAHQVADGMRFLHERKPSPIIHGDLKNSNLLLDDEGNRVLIADFGLSCKLTHPGMAMQMGALTASISPPEVLLHPTAPRTVAADVYAFAIVLLEIMQGTPAFYGVKAADIKQKVTTGGRPTMPSNLTPDIRQLISDCWAQDAAKRPTFVDIATRLEQAIRAIHGNWQGHVFNDTTVTGF